MSNSATIRRRVTRPHHSAHTSIPRGACAPRFASVLLRHPPREPRGWRSADRRLFLICCAALLRRGGHLAIGALAHRRSTATILGPGSPRQPSPALPPDAPRGARRPGHQPWPAARRTSRARSSPGTPRPLRHQDRLRRRPFPSGISCISSYSYCSQQNYSFRSRKGRPSGPAGGACTSSHSPAWIFPATDRWRQGGPVAGLKLQTSQVPNHCLFRRRSSLPDQEGEVLRCSRQRVPDHRMTCEPAQC
jgi:hypothetical protein